MSRLLSVVCCVVLLVLAVLAGPVRALHANGFVWSANPIVVSTTAITEIDALNGPFAQIYYYEIYVFYKPKASTAVQYMHYNWGQGTPWLGPVTLPNANSTGGAAFINYYRYPTAVWSDASTYTLRFVQQNYNTGVWGHVFNSTYSAQNSPPNLYWPYLVPLFVFHKSATSTAFGNCSFDGYSVFEDFPTGKGTHAFNHGSTCINNNDQYAYIFYLGVNSGGSATGYINFMLWNTYTNWWSNDTQTRFQADTDSTVNAQAWQNSSDTYIFVFYKWQGVVNYFAVHSSTLIMLPATGSVGFSTGLATVSGPTAVVFQDPFYATQIIQIYYSKWNVAQQAYLIYMALGIPDNWP